MRISSLRPRGLRGALLAALLSTSALVGLAAGQVSYADTPASAQTNGTGQTPIQPPQLSQQLPDFSNLVAHVRPAVVSVTTELRPQVASSDEEDQSPPFGMGPFGMFPFGVPGMPRMPGMPMRPHPVEARGSGFIISPDGTIVTNNHVVQDAKSVSVTLDDGTTLPAKIVGTDPQTDIAVLRVHADHPLPYLELGDSDKVKVGEWVIAVGNPYGLGGTVTAGIVSARGRDIGSSPYDSFLQIDAPINRGNSGGPLFTQDGRVVGVNTAILSPTGGSIGIGFAIPSNTVKFVVSQIEKNGHVTRGYLGVQVQPVTPGIAAALNLPKSEGHDVGALVAEVSPDTPAAKAGIKAGDVITEVNGQKVKNPRDLAMDIAAIKPGDEAKLNVIREGQSKTFDVTVAQLPTEQTASSQGEANHHEGIGLALAPISPEMRDQLNLPENTHGALVAEVKPGSPADRAGVHQGDVIVGVGTKSVNSPEEAAHDIRKAIENGHAVALRLYRDGHMAFVGVNPKGSESSAG
jgi:serine protease Do